MSKGNNFFIKMNMMFKQKGFNGSSFLFLNQPPNFVEDDEDDVEVEDLDAIFLV